MKAKKIAISLSMYFVILSMVYSQKNTLLLGSKIALGQTEYMGHDFENTSAGLYMGIGGSAEYHFTKYFGIIGDAMFIGKSFQMKGNAPGTIFGNPDGYAYRDKFHFYQIQIPLMAKLRLGTDHFGFRAFAGPALNFNIASMQSRVFEDDAYNNDNGYYNRSMNDINILEKGFMYGVGIEIKGKNNEKYIADLRSGQSISSIGKINEKDIFLRSFNISIACLF